MQVYFIDNEEYFQRKAFLIDEIGEAFLRDGLRMVVNKHPVDEVQRLMTERIKNTYHNDMLEAKVIRSMAKIAPAFGVLGTLLGLVMMMRSLDSSHPELMTSLGTGMGTALLSIFYGVLLSNFLFTPVAVKIENRAACSGRAPSRSARR